ncbi:exosome complex protein Rrp42 [Candidatus Woesearchaeota archaeon]|nr:exosome complex protein Rrp42 [Candidatus Woesearchaeota archaeon]
MNKELKKHIEKYLNSNTRYDNRKLTEFRKVSIEPDCIKTAEGSCRVKIGKTDVLVGVKFELGKPYPDKLDQGTITVNTELLPMSSPDFEPGPPGIDAIEIARVVDRGIRESGALDMKKLCVKKGELVWIVAIDICTLNHAGNILDAAGLAAIIALKTARYPSRKGENVDYKSLTKTKLSIKKTPIPITVLKIGKHFIVDPLVEEEKVLDSRLTITTTKDKKICSLQKAGDEPLSLEDIEKMIDLALEKSEEIRKIMKK